MYLRFFPLYFFACIVSFCSRFFFSLLSPYSPALAHQMSSLPFFYVISFPSYTWYSSFQFRFLCCFLSFTQYFEFLSPIHFFILFWPRGPTLKEVIQVNDESHIYQQLWYQLSPLNWRKTHAITHLTCFPNQFPLLLFSRFICIKYFPIVVMYFPDIADPESQL